MGRLTDEMLRRWDADPDAGYEARSPFTVWWIGIVRASIKGSKDSTYAKCIESLEGALYDTRYSLYDVTRAPKALAGLLQAMELLRGCDGRLVPDDPNTLDLEDLSQMLYLCAFQFDLWMEADADAHARTEWEQALNSWYANQSGVVQDAIALTELSVPDIRDRVEYEDDYYFDALDEITWVTNMLEWYKLDDPRRDLQVDLDAWQRQTAQYETALRPWLKHLREAGLAAPDEWAPRRFWWRAKII